MSVRRSIGVFGWRGPGFGIGIRRPPRHGIIAHEENPRIELSEKQALALEQQKAPLQVINPRTQEVFVLIKQEVYALTCKIVGGGEGQVWDDAATTTSFGDRREPWRCPSKSIGHSHGAMQQIEASLKTALELP